MTLDKKIKIEITPDNDMDANKLRDKIHNYITRIRKGCKSVRSWVVSTKNVTK